MVQRTGGVNIQAFQVVAEALDGVDALFGAVVGQAEAANAFIQIGMFGVDADQSGHGALVVAQLHQYFAQFFQLAGGHGGQGVEVMASRRSCQSLSKPARNCARFSSSGSFRPTWGKRSSCRARSSRSLSGSWCRRPLTTISRAIMACTSRDRKSVV